MGWGGRSADCADFHILSSGGRGSLGVVLCCERRTIAVMTDEEFQSHILLLPGPALLEDFEDAVFDVHSGVDWPRHVELPGLGMARAGVDYGLRADSPMSSAALHARRTRGEMMGDPSKYG